MGPNLSLRQRDFAYAAAALGIRLPTVANPPEDPLETEDSSSESDSDGRSLSPISDSELDEMLATAMAIPLLLLMLPRACVLDRVLILVTHVLLALRRAEDDVVRNAKRHKVADE
jgi:hypothetical protein